MDRSASRSSPGVPSPWWVLLPGVLLVLVGVRAVTAEVDRAREDARDRARSAARQVARAFETLVDEYLAPLPSPGSVVTVEQIEEVTRHLYPSWSVTTEGRWIPTGESRKARPVRPTTPEVEERDAEFAAAVLARLEAEAEDDPLAAAALLAGAAEAVETQWVEGTLRVAAARAEVRRGNAESALRQLERVFALPPTIAAPRESRLGPSQPWLAAVDALIDAVGVPEHPGPPRVTPAWTLDVVEVVAADPWGLRNGRRESLLANLQQLLNSRGGQSTFADAVDLRERVRTSCRELGDLGTCVILVPMLAIQRRVLVDQDGTPVTTFVGGAIPEETVDQRLSAVVMEAGSAAQADITLRTFDGTVALTYHSSPGGWTLAHYPAVAAAFTTDVRRDVLEETAIGGAAQGWRVEARVDEPTGLPTSAWLLGGALVGASVLLGLGAFALSRAATHHARLAEERRNFLDHVAHEVRTPAAAMLALSEELERGHVDPERHATYHEHLLRESRRLADLVEETLDLTRLESGRLVAKREAADLRDVLRTAIDAARVEPDKLTVTMPGEPVPVNVDVAAVRRAARNLIDNALKHGACDEPVDVRLAVSGGRATLTVRDHGRGIPAEHVERVFERFHRVPSSTHEVKGVGLGLALVREVAEAHGGSVAAENADGGGARFTFVLPTSAVDAPSVVSPSKFARPTERGS